MTRIAGAIGSRVYELSAGVGGRLALRLMRAPLAAPGMSHWTSGSNHWPLAILAPDARSAATVISNFRQLVPDGRMKIHPGILGLLDAETLRAWFGSSSSKSALPDPRDDLEEQEGVPK